MARRKAHAPLQVFLNGRSVGVLRRETSGAIDFTYDRDWLAWDNAIPVSLSLPLREDRYIGAPVAAVFDNLLPDNEEVRRRLAERSHAAGSDAYSLLSAVGRDCVGALQFLPEGDEPGPAGTIDGRPVTDKEIAAMVRDLGRNPLGIGSDAEFRISLAGAQEKTALLRRDGQWFIPHGTTATTHILKPQIGKLPNGMDLSHSVENEHLCMEIVAALGLPTAASTIADFDRTRVLVIERFDRLWTKDGRLLRLPQDDCCQALSFPPSRKYESEGGPGLVDLLKLVKGSDEPEADQATLLKAQIVFWLLGATDGHAKNFSLRLARGGRFRLAPLYDIVSAQPSADAREIPKNRMKLAMAVGNKRHYVVDAISGRHFVETADKALVSRSIARTVMTELVETARGTIDRVIDRLPQGFPANIAESVRAAAAKRLNTLASATSGAPA